MDPLSISAGVLALLTASTKVGLALRDFHGGVAVVEAKVKGLLQDVESFTKVLQNIQRTLGQENVKASLQATGHIGNHYKDLGASVNDGHETLLRLQETLDKANKSVSLLNGPRKHIRLQAATEEILVYQLQIRSCRDTVQLSLQTITLWNQIETQETNDRILVNLGEVHKSIFTLARDLNAQIAGLQNSAESNERDDEIRALTNARKTVQSAATVVSTASTAMGLDNTDQRSAYGSDFGDLFPTNRNEAMERWMSSITVYEFGELESTGAGERDIGSKNHAEDSEGSDSESELEQEIVESFLNQGISAYNQEDFPRAERLFSRCRQRLGNAPPTGDRQRLKANVTNLLLETLLKQNKHDESQVILKEKLTQASRGSMNDQEESFLDMLILTDLLYRKMEYKEAHLYGRKVFKGCRKLGPSGSQNTEAALKLLVLICRADGNPEEEEAYSVVLRSAAARNRGHDVLDSTEISLELRRARRISNQMEVADLSTINPNPVESATKNTNRNSMFASSSITPSRSLDLYMAGVGENSTRSYAIDRGPGSSGSSVSVMMNPRPSSSLPLDSTERISNQTEIANLSTFNPNTLESTTNHTNHDLMFASSSIIPSPNLDLYMSGVGQSPTRSHAIDRGPGSSGSSFSVMLNPRPSSSLPLHSLNNYNLDAGRDKWFSETFGKPKTADQLNWIADMSTRSSPWDEQHPSPYGPIQTNSQLPSPDAESLPILAPHCPPPGFVQVMVIGGPRIGKSSLIDYKRKMFSPIWDPLYEDKPPVQMRINGLRKSFHLEVIERRRMPINQSYPELNVIIICFSLANSSSLGDVHPLAMEARIVHKDVPMILVGLAEDTHIEWLNRTPTRRHAYAKKESKRISEVCRSIGAVNYMACSAKTGKGVEDVFRAAARLNPRLADLGSAEKLLKRFR